MDVLLAGTKNKRKYGMLLECAHYHRLFWYFKYDILDHLLIEERSKRRN